MFGGVVVAAPPFNLNDAVQQMELKSGQGRAGEGVNDDGKKFQVNLLQSVFIKSTSIIIYAWIGFEAQLPRAGSGEYRVLNDDHQQ